MNSSHILDGDGQNCTRKYRRMAVGHISEAGAGILEREAGEGGGGEGGKGP